MRVRLTRLAGGAAMREDSIVGEAIYPPRIGKPFEMTAPPLDSAYDIRLVNTSIVVAVHYKGVFTTQSGSRYVIELLETPVKA
jgi:hypothetical protein